MLAEAPFHRSQLARMYSPTLIGFELVRGCNFQCRMCPVPEFMPGKSFTFMSDGVIDWTIEQVKSIPTVNHVYLFNFGEPMAHPKFIGILEKMERELLPVKRSRGLTVEMFTNGSLLTGAKAEAILDTQILSSLVLSFDGYGDKQSFEAMRGEWYDKVLANVRAFAPQAAARRPDLILQTNSVVPKAGEGVVGEAPERGVAQTRLSELFAPLGFKVNVKSMHNYAGDVDLALKADNLQIKPKGSCWNVESDQVFVSGNGKIMPCCSSMDEGLAIGDSTSGKTMLEIYNDQPMSRLRHLLRTDRRGEIEQCKNCLNSMQGSDSEEAFTANFWLNRHAEHPVVDPDERAIIFGGWDPDGEAAVIQRDLAARSDNVARQSRRLPDADPAASTGHMVGYLDRLQADDDTVTVEGWMGDLSTGLAVERVAFIGSQGPVAPDSVRMTWRRELAGVFGKPEFAYAGFVARFPRQPGRQVRVLGAVGEGWGELVNAKGLELADG